ncbi:AAA family ATPase [Pseudomonas aeruginosa]
MKVLVLTGPESSGKSWLAEQLQARFGGRVVGEYVRHFIDEQRRDTCYADIPAIARGQLAWEDAARAERPALLILDTHLLSNILWSRILFGACPDWLEPALLRRRYDLHLLLSPEGVAWSADGQRCQPELAQRQAFDRLALALPMHAELTQLRLDGQGTLHVGRLVEEIAQAFRRSLGQTLHLA